MRLTDSTDVESSVRLVLVQDHPAARRRLESALASAHDLQVVGVTSRKAQLWPLLNRARPHVLVLDLVHPADGLDVCLEIERWAQRPGLATYTTLADDTLALAAALAGVGAVLAESSSPAALLQALRGLAGAPLTLQSVPWRTAREVAARLDPSDHAIFAMRLAGDPPAKIGDLLGVSADAVSHRIGAIIASIRPLLSAGA